MDTSSPPFVPASSQRTLMALALQFLTRVPVSPHLPWSAAAMNASVRYFPLVGALVGIVGALVWWTAEIWWPTPVAVLLSMAATVWFTGAFHEDGWADTCDGLGGHVSRDQALAIMKDSRLGSYGAVGLGLVLALKATALMFWPLGDGPLVLIWLHAMSRLAPVVLMGALPYAGNLEGAKSKPMAQHLSASSFHVACLSLLVLAGMLWGMGLPLLVLLISAAGGGMATLVCGRWFGRRLGGYTGDCLGASQQMAELAGVLLGLAWVGGALR